MMKCFKRGALLLAAVMLCMALPALAEGGTTLTIELLAMYATHNGTYQAQPVEGEFTVQQGQTVLCTVKTGETVSLDVTGRVKLYPVEGSFSEHLLMGSSSFPAFVTAGVHNDAPVIVYADAGLFTVQADQKAAFVLTDLQHETVLEFTTDETGAYALPVAIPSGTYILTMTSPANGWTRKAVEIVAYEDEASITRIDADYSSGYQLPELPAVTEAPTATPTVEPTLVPTEVPTATPTLEPTPAPTEVPTATPTAEPTQAPTEAPTAEPAGEPAAAAEVQNLLALECLGDDVSLRCTVTDADGAEAASGILSVSAPFAADLAAGEYTVTLALPEGVVLTGLDGRSAMQYGNASWTTAVTAGGITSHKIHVEQTAAIMGLLVDVPGESLLTITSASTMRMEEAYDEFYVDELLSGEYTITVHLPLGEYIAEGYTLAPDTEMEGVAATITVVIDGEDVTLPTITRLAQGAVSGIVTDSRGRALAGVAVTVRGAAGETYTARTDEAGAWSLNALPYGEYTVEYAPVNGLLIPESAFALTQRRDTAEVSAMAGEPAELTAFAFGDANGNGTKGNNEEGLGGIVMSLVSVDGETVYDTGVTDSRGYVTLTAPEGACRLQAEAPEGYGFNQKGTAIRHTHSIMEETVEAVQQSEVLTLVSGETLEVGVGMTRMSFVTGTIWHDEDGNGLWDEGENGIPGVRVTMHGVRNGLDYEVETDADGVYRFDRVKNGTYDLTCHVPDEYVFTVKAKGDIALRSRMTTEADREGTERIDVDRGDAVTDYNVGLMTGLVIEGVCFVDMNGNGIYDSSDLPLPGVELKLSRQSNNVLLKTAVSGEDGAYRFEGLRGSTFGIRVLLPVDYTFTELGSGENGNRFPPLESGKRERKIGDIEVENGGHETVMVGAISFGSISGVVYYDDDYSGAWQSGEKIAQGKTVALYDEQGERVASAKTNKSGAFTFSRLMPGTYTLRMTPDRGKAFTAVGTGNVMRNTPDGKGISTDIILGNGEDLTHQDIGMMMPARVEGVVFHDANDNGVQDKGEKGLQGTIVRLMSRSGEADHTAVDADGSFVFPGVAPGEYQLVYDLPAGAAFSPVTEGGNAIADASGSAFFTIEAEETLTAPLCGGLLLGEIGGYAYGDPNGNGVMDAGEAYQAGLTITLMPTRSDLAPVTIVTGEDGAFAIKDIRPDTYTLTVCCPNGSVLSRVQNVSLGLVQGAAEQSVTLKVGPGDAWLDQFLGCVLPSEWSGSAWYDENDNGVHETGEAPAAGEIIYLCDAATGERLITAVVEEDGSFTVSGIAPGSYYLAFPLDQGLRAPKNGVSFAQQDDMMVTATLDIWESSHYTGAELAIVRETTLSGKAWLAMGDEVRAMEDVTVRLYSAAGALLEETETGADGRYTFEGLMPGDYQISAVIPTGYAPVPEGEVLLEDLGQISIISAVKGNEVDCGIVNVEMAQHQMHLDIGAALPGKLGDRVWLDVNVNGLQDGDEGGIPGITIELLRDGEVLATTISDQYGFYLFEDLYPTEYTLRVNWPAEVTPTLPRTDIGLIVSVLQSDGTTFPLLVPSNGRNYEADLGFVLVDPDVLPEGYGAGETQNWKYKK